MFVSDEIVSEIADDMQSSFEHGDLFSQSPIHVIARTAREHLADRGLPTRKSLSFVIAKLALATFQETIHQTKGELLK